MAGKTPRNISIAIGVFAIIQASFGIGMTTCCTIMYTKGKDYSTPYLSSIPLMLTGFIGILVPFSRNQCLLTFYLIINIFVALIVIVCVCISWLLLGNYERALTGTYGCINVHDADEVNCRCETAGHPLLLRGIMCNQIKTVSVLLEIITILGGLGGSSSIATCICACVGLCCCNSRVSSQSSGDAAERKANRIIQVQSGTDTLQSDTNTSSGGNHTLDSLPDNLEDMISITSLEDLHNNINIIRFKPTEGVHHKPPPPPPAKVKAFDPVVPSYVW